LVTDANTCQNWDTTTVTVSGCLAIQQNASGFDIHTYPNPNHGAFTLHANFADSKDVTIALCNMLGETVKVIDDTNLSGNYKKEISISEMPDGIYFLTVKTKEGTQIKK